MREGAALLHTVSSTMTRDYYALLQRALAAPDFANEQVRSAVYDRARSAIGAADLSPAERHAERSTLEAAIERIEAERHRQHAHRFSRAKTADREIAPVVQSSRAWLVLGAVGVLLMVTGVVLYAPWTMPIAKTAGGAGKSIVSAPPAADTRRSTDAERSYIFNRQLVYYRTIHPAGTVLIAKAQRFLYLVASNGSAIRYTIGVGRECENVAGLLLVSAKEQWPEGLAQQVSDFRQPSTRFGVRSLALSDSGHRIHGTSARTVTDNGCFPLINEDIVHLHDRVAVGTRVVIN